MLMSWQRGSECDLGCEHRTEPITSGSSEGTVCVDQHFLKIQMAVNTKRKPNRQTN